MVKHQDLQMFGVTLNNTSNFHPLEVVDRGSETQLQVGENLNTTTRVNNVLQSTQKCLIWTALSLMLSDSQK